MYIIFEKKKKLFLKINLYKNFEFYSNFKNKISILNSVISFFFFIRQKIKKKLFAFDYLPPLNFLDCLFYFI
jgi:hypothetical protein